VKESERNFSDLASAINAMPDGLKKVTIEAIAPCIAHGMAVLDKSRLSKGQYCHTSVP